MHLCLGLELGDTAVWHRCLFVLIRVVSGLHGLSCCFVMPHLTINSFHVHWTLVPYGFFSAELQLMFINCYLLMDTIVSMLHLLNTPIIIVTWFPMPCIPAALCRKDSKVLNVLDPMGLSLKPLHRKSCASKNSDTKLWLLHSLTFYFNQQAAQYLLQMIQMLLPFQRGLPTQS